MRLPILALIVCCYMTVAAQNGTIVGVTVDGVANSGKVFRFKPDGSSAAISKAFPMSADGESIGERTLTIGPDGDLYGTTSARGLGQGTFFKIKISDDSFVKLFDFPVITRPTSPFGTLLAASNGYLYGYQSNQANGLSFASIFRIKPDGTGYSTITELPASPDRRSGLASGGDGYLYGTTMYGGTYSYGMLFRITLDGTLETIMSFNQATTGFSPNGRVKVVNGRIYGSLMFNPNSNSIIYRVNTNGTDFKVIHTFTGTGDMAVFSGFEEGPGSDLFGVSQPGKIFKIGMDDSYTEVASVHYPSAFFSIIGNTIYSTNGTVFTMSTSGDDIKYYGALDGVTGEQGIGNQAAIALPNGIVYGIAKSGGLGNEGTIYKVDTKAPLYAPALKVVKDFYAPTEGQMPLPHLVLLGDGDLIGATNNGGTKNKGTLFRMSANGTNYRTIFNFGDIDIEGNITSTPVVGKGGRLYGVTSVGVFYSINDDGSDFVVTFRYSDSQPNGSIVDGFTVRLLAGPDNSLFGVYDSEKEFIYSIDWNGSNFKVIRNFDASLTNPWSPLIEGPDGFLFGSCTSSSPQSGGGIYKLKPDGTQFTVINTFTDIFGGRLPQGDMFFGSNGKLFGVCASIYSVPNSATNSQGIIFSINPDGSDYSLLHEFDFVQPRFVIAFLFSLSTRSGLIVEGPDHVIYGVEPRAGGTVGGIAFKMNLDGSNYTQLPLNFDDNPFAASMHWGGVTFIPEKQQQTITFGEIAPKELSASPFQLTATASSSLGVTYSSSDPGIATVSGNTVTVVAEGLVTITAHQTGSAGYFAAPDVARKLRVGKLTPQITMMGALRGIMGEEIELKNSFEGPQDIVVYSATNETGVATIAGHKLTLTSPGTVKVTLSIAPNEVYHTNDYVTRQVVIEKKPVHPQIKVTTNSTVGSEITLELDKKGSEGSVTWTVTDVTGSASVSSGKLKLNSVGSVIVKAVVAEDATHNSGKASHMIVINDPPSSQAQVYGVMRRGGPGNAGALYSMNADGTGYRVIKNFLPEPSGTNFRSSLISANNGKYYGTTLIGGGLKNAGVLFEYNDITGEYTVIHEFSTLSNQVELTAGSDGFMYGITSEVNTTNLVILKINPATHTMTTTNTSLGIYANTALTETTPGVFYAYARTSSGKSGIFKYDANTNAVTIRYEKPSNPYENYTDTRLILANGKLYRSISREQPFRGGVLEFDPATDNGVIKMQFAESDAVTSFGGLKLRSDGKLQGLVQKNSGTYVIEYVPGTSSVNFKTKQPGSSFSSSGRLLSDNLDGKFYVIESKTGSSLILEYDQATNKISKRFSFDDMRFPNVLALVPTPDGGLLGTMSGGKQSGGSIFKYHPATNTFDERFSLAPALDGLYPNGVDIKMNSKLYGTATSGDGRSLMVFEYDIATGQYRGLPAGLGRTVTETSVFRKSDEVLYTLNYNINEQHLTELNLANGEYTFRARLADFPPNQFGIWPTVTKAGRVFGISDTGGNGNTVQVGNFVYEVNPATGETIPKKEFQPLSSFSVPAEGPDGKIYAFRRKTNAELISYDPATNTVEELVTLPGEIGGYEGMAPYFTSDGKMYGITITGGANGKGVIFEYDPSTDVLTTKYDFTESHTHTMGTPLIEGSNNKLLGSVYERQSGVLGYLFSMDRTTGAFNIIREADLATGYRPYGSMVKDKATQSIAFNDLPAKNVTSEPFDLNATATSGLAVTYTSSNASVAEINGNKVTIKSAGTVHIQATQTGSDNFYPATPVTRSLTINKGTQVITFAEISPKTLGDASFTIVASSTSNLPVRFSTSSDKISGTPPSITLVKAGKATITASQPGDDNYEAATPVDRTFCINPAKPTITVATTTLTSSNDTGNQWYMNGTAINNATARSFTATESGTYTVRTAIEGCASELSNATEITITGLEDALLNSIEIYPNPTDHELFITVPAPSVITLSDVLGRPIHRRSATCTEKFDVSEQPNGIYFVRIELNGNLLVRKVLIY